MKKLAALLLCVCFLLAAAPAWAEEPTVSFSQREAEINGGMPVKLTLLASAPFSDDTEITVSCAETGKSYPVLFPAGKTAVSAEIPTERVSSRTTVHYAIAPGPGYTAGSGRVNLSVSTLPRVEFYLDVNLGFVDREMSVTVTCRNPASVLDHSGFQLRDQFGRLYQEKTWYDPSGWLTFRFDVTDDMEGGKYFSVWQHGVRLSEIGDGYGSISKASRHIIQTVDTDQPFMSLTIDCCYYDDATDKILAVLDKYNVKATFFMAGYFIREYPESAKKIQAHGHEIGNHSSTHPHMLELETQYLQMRQIMKPTEEIEALLGVRVRLYRPPFGENDQNVTAIARGEGQEVVMWTIDSHDWDDAFKHDPEGIIKRVTKDVGPGTIILHHLDGFNTADILDQVIPYYQNELGLTLVPVSELMAMGGRELPPMRVPDTLTQLPEEMQ